VRLGDLLHELVGLLVQDQGEGEGFGDGGVGYVVVAKGRGKGELRCCEYGWWVEGAYVGPMPPLGVMSVSL
jgi:hypothetical protein